MSSGEVPEWSVFMEWFLALGRATSSTVYRVIANKLQESQFPPVFKDLLLQELPLLVPDSFEGRGRLT